MSVSLEKWVVSLVVCKLSLYGLLCHSVTPGGPERALGGLVVLLSTPVTIIHDLTLHIAHVFLQLRFRCTSRTLQLTNVFRCGLHSQGQLLSLFKSEVFFRQQSPLNHLASQSTYRSVPLIRPPILYTTSRLKWGGGAYIRGCN